jgi:hypothetical protein
MLEAPTRRPATAERRLAGRTSFTAPAQLPAIATRRAGGAAKAPARAALATLAAIATLATLAAIAGVATPAAAAGRPHATTATNWSLTKQTDLNKTFTVAAGPAARAVEVDNFSGPIRITSHPGNDIAVVVHEVWSANSEAKLAEAQRDVRLDITQTGDRLRLYVDGPFRSRDGGIDFHGWERAGYEARFEFELEVPADVELLAKTVNGGEVRVAGVGGPFVVSNVNGPITLERMAGAGKAHTVNGDLHASFNRNPGGACTFATINGRIDVTFRPDLAADFLFKTLNGEVYTDFPYTYRDLPAAASDDSHGRHHLRSRGEFAARVAAGGAELDFSTINGDILIHRQAS